MDLGGARFVKAGRTLNLDVVDRATAIQKAGYRLIGRSTSTIGSPTATTVALALRFREGTPEPAAHDGLLACNPQPLDHGLSEQIREQTAAVRALTNHVADQPRKYDGSLRHHHDVPWQRTQRLHPDHSIQQQERHDCRRA